MASPTICVPKKDRTSKFSTEFWKLSSATARNLYILPNIDQCLAAHEEAQNTFAFDANTDYLLIPARELDEMKRALNRLLRLY